jgi:hypothetical protein
VKDGKPTKEKEKRPYRWFRRLLRIWSGIAIIFILIILFIRSPWGQNIIVNKLTQYISDQTNTVVNIERCFITFDGNVQLDGVFLEDQKGDTLVYSKSIEADIPLWKTISGEAYGVEKLTWIGLKANLIRKDSLQGFNYQFLIDAFASNSDEKETESKESSVEIILGSFQLIDIDIRYVDNPEGIDSKFKFDELIADIKDFDLDAMKFKAGRVSFKNSDISIIQTKVNSASSESSMLPELSIENFKIIENKTFFSSSEITSDFYIHTFQTSNSHINLNTRTFEIEKINFYDSDIDVSLNSDEVSANNKSLDNQNFEWPELKLKIGSIDFKDNNFKYSVNIKKPGTDIFDAESLDFKDLFFKANDLVIDDYNFKLNIDNFSFLETSGLHLDAFEGHFNLDNEKITVQDLSIQLNSNKLRGKTSVQYTDFNSFLENPELAEINLDLPLIDVSLEELFKFQPKLKENRYINTLSKENFKGSLMAKGTLQQMSLSGLDLNWGSSTGIKASAKIENLTNFEDFKLDVPGFIFNTVKKDINSFIDASQLAVNLPEYISVSGTVNGSIDEFYTNTTLKSGQGSITLDGNFKNNDEVAFDAKLVIDDYQIDQLIGNQDIGVVSASIRASGSGSDVYDMNAVLDASLTNITYRDYSFKGLTFNGKLQDGKGNLVTDYKDDNLNLDLKANVELDSIKSYANVYLNVIGADLSGLGLTQRNIKTGFKFSLKMLNQEDVYSGEASLEEGVVVYNDQSYILGSLKSKLHISSDSTSISVKNRLLDFDLKSNTDPEHFSTSLSRHISGYFYRDSKVPDTIIKPVRVDVEGRISRSPFLKEILLVNLVDMDTIDFSLNFDEKNRILKTSLTAPYINYNNSKVDSLNIDINTDENSFGFNFGFNNITSGPINIPQTKISGLQKDNELALKFEANDDKGKFIYIDSKINGNRDELRYSIKPDSLILNRNPWKISEKNSAVLKGDSLFFDNFELSRNDQTISLKSDFSNVVEDHVGIHFENFKLNAILSYFNPNKKLAKGELDGDVILVRPFESAGILADMMVSDFQLLDTDLGVLKINAKSKQNNTYNLTSSLKDGLIDLDLQGEIDSNENQTDLDLSLDINKFQMKALNTLSLGEVKDVSGFFSGQFKISGNASSPEYSGELNFVNSTFNIAKLNSEFLLENEKLKLNKTGIVLENFNVQDTNQNTLMIDGKIGTDNMLNPSFDLALKADNFKALDAKKDDNELFFGSIFFDTDVTIKGDLNIPVVKGSLSVNSNTDFVYIIPQSVASVEKRDGVVRFVNRKNPDKILTSTEKQVAKITGFDVDTKIQVSENAKFKIIIDENTGDNFQTTGKGDLNFRMFPNGKINLYGIYESTSGHYELNLYNLVKRKFNIDAGSNVKWNGDPFNAELDVKAIYNVETSASSLMASGTSSLSPTERGKYRQVLPFQVYLNIGGELFQPEIDFRLDMPEDDRSALNGQVYSRVQQVNQRESELNQQVFSLLVLNRFYPTPGNDGSTGGIQSLAQQNINDAISDRLNQFSDQVLGNSGIELDFGLDSFTDYQGNTAQQRTQLNVSAQKKLFNDRLTVRVGSDVNVQGSGPTEESTPVIGNVSLIYDLTKDGRYRLRGFRRNRFENVIDGQTIVSGIALIFTQEFNRFSELWKALFDKKTEDDEKDTQPKAIREEEKNDSNQESDRKNQ